MALLAVAAASPARAQPERAAVLPVARATAALAVPPPVPVPAVSLGRVARATRLAGAINIDGALDDAAWAAATAHRGFVQREPDDRAAPSFETEFRILYGETSLYVGVRAFDPDPASIRGLLSRRDADNPSDKILIGLDSYHDRRTAFVFALNPAGVQSDFMIYDDTDVDPSWDAVWEGAASVDASGWSAEFRIPFGQLRFSAAAEQVWGLQIAREIRRLGESDVWSPWPRGDEHVVSRFGEVRGLSEIPAARRIELMPFAVGGGSFYRAEDGDPLNAGPDTIYGAGLDLKLGLGSSFTVSATINPDFGQVEADPSQVNLGAGELFFPEKRPFFTEGADLFRFGLGQDDDNVEQLFYSRRLGAAPHADGLDSASYVDQPAVTTIYGATKLSGKTSSGWSFGVLEAVTGEEVARVSTDGTGASQRLVIEPLTNYAVARVRKDLRQGRTLVGGALTAVNRSLEGTGLGWLHDQAYAGGLELSHRFGGDRFSAAAKLMGSWVHGSAEAIDRTQTSSVHWFQRPDAEHVGYDPTRTGLAGLAAGASISKTAGELRFSTGVDSRTPGFETNDLGFQQGSDYLANWYWVQKRDDQPGRYLRDLAVSGEVDQVWNHGGEFLGANANLNGSVGFLNQWGGSLGLGAHHGRRDPGGLRGGPTLRRDTTFSTSLGGWSDPRRALRGGLGGHAFWAPASDSRGFNVNPSLGWQVASNADLELGPSLHVSVDDNQYVDAAIDVMGAPHYVMARIHQITTGLMLRASYTMSPDLSVQLYAQPFIATGRYVEYKEVVDPQATAYDDRYHTYDGSEIAIRDGGEIGIDQDGDGAVDYRFAPADFSFRQLRSNLVLRWEYRPGSALFCIWSHDRTSAASDGRYDLGGELSGLADQPGEHIVMAKISYWLGL